MSIVESYKNTIYLILIIIIVLLIVVYIINKLMKKDIEHMENIQNCREPTVNNPFMNIAATEYGINSLPGACKLTVAYNSDDSDIKEDLPYNLNLKLFYDIEEIWDDRRQYYTLPNTSVPNNQIGFAEWLYKLPDSTNCKLDQKACLKYEPKYDYLKYNNIYI